MISANVLVTIAALAGILISFETAYYCWNFYFTSYQSMMVEDDTFIVMEAVIAKHLPEKGQQYPEYDKLVEIFLGNQSRITPELFQNIIDESTDQWKSRGASIKVQILNNTIYVDRRHYWTSFPWDKLRYHHILERVRHILTTQTMPDFEFILNTHDCPLREPRYGPVFSITRCRGMNILPVPQWFSWRDGAFENWDGRMQKYRDVVSTVRWDEREKKAIFRGNVRPSVLQFNSTMGKLQFVNITKNTYDKLGRTKLYVLGQRHPDLLDVGLYGKGLDGSKPIIEYLNYEFKPPISMSDQALKFQYVIYAEGACGWADRLKNLLTSGMVIFLQDTPCVEFFQPALHPWVHFIPVANDFTDLIDKLKWADDNEEAIRDIVDNAMEFSHHYNSQNGWDYYLQALLKGYSQLFNYRPVKRVGMRRYVKECRCPNRRDLKCFDESSFE